VPRESVVRGVAVAVITASITLAAACSDEDVVDTIPPPRPNPVTSTDGPMVSFPTTTPESTSTSTTTTAP
jgi:hypothetical protein